MYLQLSSLGWPSPAGITWPWLVALWLCGRALGTHSGQGLGVDGEVTLLLS